MTRKCSSHKHHHFLTNTCYVKEAILTSATPNAKEKRSLPLTIKKPKFDLFLEIGAILLQDNSKQKHIQKSIEKWTRVGDLLRSLLKICTSKFLTFFFFCNH